MKINSRKLFDWSVKSVSEPKYVILPDGNLRYEVTVNYTHHGNRTVRFSFRNNFLWSDNNSPMWAAKKYYDDMLTKIKKQELNKMKKGVKMNINLRKIGNWRISSLSAPRYVAYPDGTSGYEVKVNYTHHGERTIFFNMYDESLWVLQSTPKKAAQNCFIDFATRMQKRLGRSNVR